MTYGEAKNIPFAQQTEEQIKAIRDWVEQRELEFCFIAERMEQSENALDNVLLALRQLGEKASDQGDESAEEVLDKLTKKFVRYRENVAGHRRWLEVYECHFRRSK